MCQHIPVLSILLFQVFMSLRCYCMHHCEALLLHELYHCEGDVTLPEEKV